ncbi:MAG TPA: hypothetical protein VF815_28770, partial [Myxococcaceae bacterium]
MSRNTSLAVASHRGAGERAPVTFRRGLLAAGVLGVLGGANARAQSLVLDQQQTQYEWTGWYAGVNSEQFYAQTF